MNEKVEMTIEETESILIIRNASMEVIKFLKKIPFELILWEGTAKDSLFGVHFTPNDSADLSDIIEASENYHADEDNKDITVFYTLYFLKRDPNEKKA